MQNNVEHGLRFLKYLVVPEPQHEKTLRFDSTVTTFVVAMLFLVLPAIKLDYDLRFETREIRDIAVNRNLAAETVSAKLATAQLLPKVLLCVCRLVSQLAGTTL